MSDKTFLISNGFEICHTAETYFELLYLKLKDSAVEPKFNKTAQNSTCEDNGGFKVFYSNQCPYMNYYIELQSKVAKEQELTAEKKFKTIIVEIINSWM